MAEEMESAGATASAHNAKAVAGISTAELVAIIAERQAQYEAEQPEREIAGLEKSIEKLKVQLAGAESALAAARGKGSVN